MSPSNMVHLGVTSTGFVDGKKERKKDRSIVEGKDVSRFEDLLLMRVNKGFDDNGRT